MAVAAISRLHATCKPSDSSWSSKIDLGFFAHCGFGRLCLTRIDLMPFFDHYILCADVSQQMFMVHIILCRFQYQVLPPRLLIMPADITSLSDDSPAKENPPKSEAAVKTPPTKTPHVPSDAEETAADVMKKPSGKAKEKAKPKAKGKAKPPSDDEVQGEEQKESPVTTMKKPAGQNSMKRPSASSAATKSKKPKAETAAGSEPATVCGVMVKEAKYHEDGRIRVTKGFYARDGVHGLKIGKTEVMRASWIKTKFI